MTVTNGWWHAAIAEWGDVCNTELLAWMLLLCFLQHFDLVEEKELAPLSELIEQFLAGKMNSIR